MEHEIALPHVSMSIWLMTHGSWLRQVDAGGPPWCPTGLLFGFVRLPRLPLVSNHKFPENFNFLPVQVIL